MHTNITVLIAQGRLGKTYSLRDGVLQKTSVATAKGRAFGVRVNSAQDHAALLNEVTGDPSTVLIPGHFIGNDGDQPFDIVYDNELAGLLGKPRRTSAGACLAPQGVMVLDYTERPQYLLAGLAMKTTPAGARQ